MNIIEISDRFKTEKQARNYAEKVRWGKKKKCPYCRSENLTKRQKDQRFHCNFCHKSFSVTTNSLLHNTRLPLKTWYYAIALVTDAKKGVSAKQLQRNINVTYKVAWRMGLILRIAMRETTQHIKLNGVVEMDETYVGGKPRKPNVFGLTSKDKDVFDKKLKQFDKKYDITEGKYKKRPSRDNKRGRGTKKTPVAGVVTRDGDVVAKVMENLTGKELRALVVKHVDLEDSLLITDTFKGYSGIDKIIKHITVDHTKMFSYRGINTNTIESFWAIVKRGIMGQYHQVSKKYLPEYIVEFVFKYKYRRKDAEMFDVLLANLLTTPYNVYLKTIHDKEKAELKKKPNPKTKPQTARKKKSKSTKIKTKNKNN